MLVRLSVTIRLVFGRRWQALVSVRQRQHRIRGDVIHLDIVLGLLVEWSESCKFFLARLRLQPQDCQSFQSHLGVDGIHVRGVCQEQGLMSYLIEQPRDAMGAGA